MRPVGAWDDKQRANLVANYRRLGKEGDAYYLDVLAETARGKGRGLDFEKTFRAFLKAAEEGRFLSYKQLADESGVAWSRMCYVANQYLGDLIEFVHRKGWLLLSAIVVNQQNLEDGHMELTTLKGFCAAARALGSVITDPETFLKDQQNRAFEWAAMYAEAR